MTDKVISIVERLEQRQMERLRKLSDEKHIRELEAQVEWLDYKKMLETSDIDSAIEEMEDPRERAKLRCVRGLKRCFAGEVEAGQAEWREVIREVSDLSLPHICLARWVMQTEPHAALEHFDRAAEAEPDDPTVYSRRGDCYVKLEDYPRAIANYRRALGIDPTSIDCLYAMGKALAASGELEEAIKFYDQAISRAPRYTDFYLSRAMVHAVLDNHEAAVADCTRILELDPARAPVRLIRARSLAELGRKKEAMDDLAFLQRAEPDQHIVLDEIGKLHIASDEHEEAIEILTRSIEVAPDHAEAYHQRALAWMKSGDLDRAEIDMRRAVELAAGHVESTFILLALEGRSKTAVERVAAVEAAIERFPNFPLLVERRAELHAEMGDHERALVDFDAVIERWGSESMFYIGRAKSRASLGNLEGALADAEKAVELDPANGTAFAMRAAYRSAVVAEDDGRIAEDYERAVELKPNDVTIRYYRAHWLMESGAYAAGLENFDKVIQIIPKHGEAHFGRAKCRYFLDDEASEADDWEEEEPEAIEARNRLVLQDLERARELGHFDEEVAHLLYWVHRDLDGKEAAAEILDTLIEELPTAMLYRTRASIRREANNVDGAAADDARANELYAAETSAAT